MVFRFSTHSKTSSLNTGENDSDELAKAGRVERRHSLIAAPCCVKSINSITRY